MALQDKRRTKPKAFGSRPRPGAGEGADEGGGKLLGSGAVPRFLRAAPARPFRHWLSERCRPRASKPRIAPRIPQLRVPRLSPFSLLSGRIGFFFMSLLIVNIALLLLLFISALIYRSSYFPFHLLSRDAQPAVLSPPAPSPALSVPRNPTRGSPR